MNKNLRIPDHIAIIMDGNGRWAKQRFFSRLRGHRAGMKAIREVTETCSELSVKFLSLFAFSTENWNRPEKEINHLWNLLIEYLTTERENMMQNNIKLKAIGRLNQLPEKALNELNYTIDLTSKNTGLTLVLALNYSGRAEIADAIRKAISTKKNKKLLLTQNDINLVKNFLYDSEIPDIDLLIRTSGEIRISNFMLWHLAYAEIVILEKFWPDFKKQDLIFSIEEFNKRDRRFGKIKSE